MILRFLALAMALVAVLGIAVLALLPEPPAPPVAEQVPPPPLARVALLTAARPVAGGTLLKPEDIGVREVPAADVPPGTLREGPDNRAAVIGAMVRRGLSQDELLRQEAVLRPGEHGFLAAVLSPGMRAVTVGVDSVSGTAGLIWPGDRVDLILTQVMAEQDQLPARRVLGEQVLAAVRVIAVDRSLVQGAEPGGAADSLRMDGSARTVTLEVSPTEATRVAVASRMGQLSLSVRAAGSPALEAASAPAVWGGDVSPALLRPAAQPPGRENTIRVFTGAQKVEEIRFR